MPENSLANIQKEIKSVKQGCELDAQCIQSTDNKTKDEVVKIWKMWKTGKLINIRKNTQNCR